MTLQRASGPIVRRIVLGTQLRRLREAKGISRVDAGYSIRASESKISRLELGRVSFKERDVADLLTLYGVMDERDRSPLLELTRQANEPGWWQGFTDVVPGWFQPYLGLEEAAVLIRTYELQFIPGLLQTKEYARAVVAGARQVDGADAVERRVQARISRQAILDRPDPPRVWAIIDEAALWRSVAGPAVMQGQLEHLIALNANPNITIQVIPFNVGPHPAEGGAFSILRFGEPDIADVVYLEHLTGAVYLDRPDDVTRYTLAMDNLALKSTAPDDTAKVIGKIASLYAA
ncbi:helix-turn-helix domain-containing protein [Frankia gtarii]|uniref:helix-turn-helix domain-containing protein n=1 Tax=Frankia gtarii TaxID=2950102 RepID=UPI0021C090D3|nr:helix-turn-helix transcriptional regulator [Frankia gtarii]